MWTFRQKHWLSHTSIFYGPCILRLAALPFLSKTDIPGTSSSPHIKSLTSLPPLPLQMPPGSPDSSIKEGFIPCAPPLSSWLHLISPAFLLFPLPDWEDDARMFVMQQECQSVCEGSQEGKLGIFSPATDWPFPSLIRHAFFCLWRIPLVYQSGTAHQAVMLLPVLAEPSQNFVFSATSGKWSRKWSIA